MACTIRNATKHIENSKLFSLQVLDHDIVNFSSFNLDKLSQSKHFVDYEVLSLGSVFEDEKADQLSRVKQSVVQEQIAD